MRCWCGWTARRGRSTSGSPTTWPSRPRRPGRASPSRAEEGPPGRRRSRRMALRIDILTLFPDLLEAFRSTSIVGAAVRKGEVDLRLTDIRSFATDAHRVVDDAPYGGGDGMVLKCEPVVAAVEATRRPGGRLIALSPRGRRLDQGLAAELARESQLVLLCGRYAGFDERIL